MSSRHRDIEKLFRKLTEEADHWPVECLSLTDGDDRRQGLFFIDRHLEEAKKEMLTATINHLSDNRVPPGDPGPEKEQSCAVSAEERTLLFTFLRPSSREDW